MDELNNLFKKPETTKEKLEELWYDFSNYYPSRVRDFIRNIKTYFRNLIKFHSILWNDQDFDYGFLENLIFLKLNMMAKYFRTARIAVGTERVYEEICWAIRIAKIAFDKEDTKEMYFRGYVNFKNSDRFLEIDKTRLDEEKYFELIKDELRKSKARKLFYQILQDYSQVWWD